MRKFFASLLAADVDILVQEIVGERLTTYQIECQNYILNVQEDRTALYEKVLSVPLSLDLKP